jgi:hypothetical protein
MTRNGQPLFERYNYCLSRYCAGRDPRIAAADWESTPAGPPEETLKQQTTTAARPDHRMFAK